MRIHYLLSLVVLSGAANIAPAQQKKLNVLIISGDDHAPYVMGCYGNKQVRTPNLDRLAAGGVRFNRAYCTSPVCTPSRQAIITGKYPRTIGVTQLRTALPEAEDTIAEMLARAGYVTGAIGKMHFNSNLKHGFQVRLDNPDHKKWLEARGRKPIPKGVETQPQWRPFKDHARVWLNSQALPFGLCDADMPGTYFAQEAIRFLQSNKNQPFFLMVNFTEPHSPFHFPVEFRGRHDPGKFAVPKVGPEGDWQVPAIFRDLGDAEKQGIIAAYHTSVEFLDRNVALVLAELERLGLADNTLVIYLGDHGYCLGHHGRFEKHSMWEVAIRAPLLVRMPGRVPAKKSSDALVSFVDLVPTILDFTQQPIPKSVQGKSLEPLLSGKTAKHYDHVFIEYSENEEAAVRTPKWAFFYGTGKRERQDGYTTGKPLPGRTVKLYDMDKDSEQTTNLAERPEHAELVADLTRLLVEHLRRTARQPELLPGVDDVHVFLDAALKPRDLK
ncbi:MAG: sulfatase [Gemmataceae bacterium]|nr:sulfatase [Gemmataceae bacterium]MCI0741081.1 sulfatase [Gemmataceae bacterium]